MEELFLSIESLPRNIAEAKVHEGYNKGTISNDVAVVKVSEPFVFDGKYQFFVFNYFSTNECRSIESAFPPENVKAGIRATSDPGPEDTVKAIGWGKAGSQMEAFKTLHEVEIKVHKTEKPQVKLFKTITWFSQTIID